MNLPGSGTSYLLMRAKQALVRNEARDGTGWHRMASLDLLETSSVIPSGSEEISAEQSANLSQLCSAVITDLITVVFSQHLALGVSRGVSVSQVSLRDVVFRQFRQPSTGTACLESERPMTCQAV